jgi:hypothetical protein
MTPDRHDGEWLRVGRFGCWIADVRAVEDLARHFCLADLELDRLLLQAPAAGWSWPGLPPAGETRGSRDLRRPA